MFGKSNFKVQAVYCDGISTFTTNAPISVVINKDEKQVTFEQRFSKVPNASKLAFIALAKQLELANYHLLDCQVYNDHLASLGCVEIEREDFLMVLKG